MADDEAAEPDPLLFRYGLPMARALRHLVDPRLWLAACHPRPSPKELDDALLADQRGSPPAPYTWWSYEAAGLSRQRSGDRVRDAITRRHEAELIHGLWRRLADGKLTAWGRRGNVAEPHTAIEAETWHHLAERHWDTGHVAGGGVEFYGVRIFDPAGLTLATAARALAPLPELDEFERLEAAGYPWPVPILLHGHPSAASFSAEDHARASALWDGFTSRLLRMLAAGTLRATGWDAAGRPNDGMTEIFAPRWQRAEDGGLYVLWPESIVRFSPDGRPFTDFDTDRLIQIRDVRVHLPAAQPIQPAEPLTVVAPVQAQPLGLEQPFDLPLLRAHYRLRAHAEARAGRPLASEEADLEWARGIMGGVSRSVLREVRRAVAGDVATKRGPRGPRN